MNSDNLVLIPKTDLMNLFGDALERNNELLRVSILKGLENKPQNYSRKRTSELLGVSLVTLWKLEKQDDLKPIRINTKVIYRASDVEAYLNRLESKRNL